MATSPELFGTKTVVVTRVTTGTKKNLFTATHPLDYITYFYVYCRSSVSEAVFKRKIGLMRSSKFHNFLDMIIFQLYE